MITLEALQTLCPDAPSTRLTEFVDPLNATVDEFGITQVANFLAQVAHESGAFRYTKELWGPTPQQAKYEGRADLGNTQLGDGFRFRGRGLIQVTGRNNYSDCAATLGLPLLDSPELLEIPMPAARSAGWFWRTHGCDAIDDFEKLTRRINGGTNGLAERYVYLGRAKIALADPETTLPGAA